MTDALRKLLSSAFVGFCAASVLIALVPLAFILFFVVTQGIARSTSISSPTCRGRSAKRAAAWPTPSSAR
jgi:hypothetical protein